MNQEQTEAIVELPVTLRRYANASDSVVAASLRSAADLIESLARRASSAEEALRKIAECKPSDFLHSAIGMKEIARAALEEKR